MIAAVVVACDSCQRETRVAATTIRAARQALAADGWEHTVENRRPTDRCPRCTSAGTRRIR